MREIITEPNFQHKTFTGYVEVMRDTIHDAGRQYFTAHNAYENCVCALVLMLNPYCKTYQFLEALPYHERPMDQLDLMNVMAHVGYYARKVRMPPQGIDTRLLPCLVIPDNGTPYVLRADNDDEEQSEYIKFINGMNTDDAEILFFERYDESRKSTSKFMREGNGRSWFRAMMGRFNGTVYQILSASFFLNVIALTTPLFIMLVYDRVISANSLDVLFMITCGAILAVFFEWRLRRIRSRGLSWLSGRVDNIIGNKILSQLLGLPPSLIEKASVSAQIARIKTFESIRDFFSGAAFLSVLELPFVVIAAIATYIIAGPLVWVPLAIALLYVGVFFIVRFYIKSVIRLAARATSARQSFVIESFEKLEAIRSLGLSEKWLQRFRKLSGQEAYMQFRLNWLGMIGENLAHSLTIIAAVATIGLGVAMVWSGHISTGALVAAMILSWRILTPFYSLCTMIPRLEQIKSSIDQVNNLMEIETEDMRAKKASRLPRIQGHVEFKNVEMNYDEKNDTILKDVSFTIQAGEYIVLTGENGAGKSTALKLIQSMYDVQQGAVRIDGFDVRQLNVSELRRQIAYVAQTPEFFEGTILENLRSVSPLATEREIENVLKMADAYDEIKRLESGLYTIIKNDDFHELSLSLRNRISLARGYLQQSSIFLIDEIPNSLLSGNVGRNLKNYIKENKEKQTIVFVNNREDFIKMADQALFFKRARAVVVKTADQAIEVMYESEVA